MTRVSYEARLNPQQNNYAYYNSSYPNSSYPMHPYGGAPPPGKTHVSPLRPFPEDILLMLLLTAYNPETDYVPPYAPPEGSSKVNPDQQGNVQAHEVGNVQQHAPPPGPPPGRAV